MSQVACGNHLRSKTLEQQYKDHFSDFRTWEKTHDDTALVYPQNLGPHLAIDEVALARGELYTVLTNKDRHGGKGCLVALVKGTKNKVVGEALARIPFLERLKVQDVTLDLALSMDWIVRTNFPQAHQIADRFHVQKVVGDALQEVRIREREKAIEAEYEQYMTCRKKGVSFHPKDSPTETPASNFWRDHGISSHPPQERWTPTQHVRALLLWKQFPQPQKAYDEYMGFRDIFETAPQQEQARVRLQEWIRNVRKDPKSPFTVASKTMEMNLEMNLEKILGYFPLHTSNAGAESLCETESV